MERAGPSSLRLAPNFKMKSEEYSWPIIEHGIYSLTLKHRHPRPLVRVGNPGDQGGVEIQDLLFTTKGPTAGAVLVEWNIKATRAGSAGMWGMLNSILDLCSLCVFFLLVWTTANDL